MGAREARRGRASRTKKMTSDAEFAFESERKSIRSSTTELAMSGYLQRRPITLHAIALHTLKPSYSRRHAK